MEPLEVVKQYEAQWSSPGDAGAMTACFAPGGTYNAPGADQLTGDAIGAFGQLFWDAFPECNLEIVTAFASGDQVAVQWEFHSGPMKGDLAGLPATGASAVARGMHLIVVEGDRLRSVEAVWDNQGFLAQLDVG